jgi:preprotein translocase subunit SecB
MQPNKTFSLQFKDFKILKIDFTVTGVNVVKEQECEKLYEQIMDNTQIAIKHVFDNSTNNLIVFLGIRHIGKKSVCNFTVESNGSFQIKSDEEHGKFDPDQLERIANINCASIMFPYLRETIADLTRRAGFPPLHIPPVNFIALADKKQHLKGEGRKAKRRIKTVKGKASPR